MSWRKFYTFVHSCTEWDEAAVSACIDALETLGRGCQIAAVTCRLPSENLRDQLIVKAIRDKVSFSRADLARIEGQVRSEVFTNLIISQNLDPWDWKTDEDDLTWEMFEEGYMSWPKTDLLRRIGKLQTIGTPEDVSLAVWSMNDPACKEALYSKALSLGAAFSDDDLKRMGKLAPDTESPEVKAFTESVHNLTRNVENLIERAEHVEIPELPKRRRRGFGILGAVLGFAAAFAGAEKRSRTSRRCDGDCAHCPAHYGYRHGRWYYGHGHMHGCERGGNGGATGRTMRN